MCNVISWRFVLIFLKITHTSQYFWRLLCGSYPVFKRRNVETFDLWWKKKCFWGILHEKSVDSKLQSRILKFPHTCFMIIFYIVYIFFLASTFFPTTVSQSSCRTANMLENICSWSRPSQPAAGAVVPNGFIFQAAAVRLADCVANGWISAEERTSHRYETRHGGR